MKSFVLDIKDLNFMLLPHHWIDFKQFCLKSLNFITSISQISFFSNAPNESCTFKINRMKYKLIIMLSLCFFWLHSIGCSHATCMKNQVKAGQFIYYSGSSINILQQLKDKVEATKLTNPVDVVVIDPGHGGRDKGCSGASSIEKIITLQLSKQLKTLIAEHLPGVKVILTRERDKFISLKKRADIANSNKADIFISVHCNYLRNASKFRGSETFVLGTDPDNNSTEAIALRENKSIVLEDAYLESYAGYDPLSPEGFIMLSLFQNFFLENSIVLAQLVDTELNNSLEGKSKGVKQGAFVVLKESNMPSILVEAGYLSNIQDETLLLSETGQQKISQAILNAIVAYKHYIE